MLSIELIDDTEKGAVGVRVEVGVLVGSGVSVTGVRLASVLVAGGVIEGSKVAVAVVNTVGVGVQVASNCIGVGVKVGTNCGVRGGSGLNEESGFT